MLKICYLVLTLANGGNPTIINFNEVLAFNENQSSIFSAAPENVIYFSGANGISAASIKVRETAEEIVEKLKACDPIRDDHKFIFVGE